jgi:hypothetical protein
MLTSPHLASDLKHVTTLSTLSTNARAWSWPHGHMVMASEPPGRVDTAHIAPH